MRRATKKSVLVVVEKVWPQENASYVKSVPRVLPSGAVEIDGSALYDLAVLHEQMQKQNMGVK